MGNGIIYLLFLSFCVPPLYVRTNCLALVHVTSYAVVETFLFTVVLHAAGQTWDSRGVKVDCTGSFSGRKLLELPSKPRLDACRLPSKPRLDACCLVGCSQFSLLEGQTVWTLKLRANQLDIFGLVFVLAFLHEHLAARMVCLWVLLCLCFFSVRSSHRLVISAFSK